MRLRYYDASVGRFISEDPSGFTDGPNLFAYVGGNPILFVDPSGGYGKDVHYYLTKYWAYQLGFSMNEAHELGIANQSLDEGLLNPFNPFGGTQNHFRKLEDIIPDLEKAIANNDLKKFGKHLHQMQDSFSHAGYNMGTAGHVFAGKVPDIYDPKTHREKVMKLMTMQYMQKFINLNKQNKAIKIKN